MKGHEPVSYETMLVVAGLLLKFTIVKMRGPNKQLNRNCFSMKVTHKLKTAQFFFEKQIVEKQKVCE